MKPFSLGTLIVACMASCVGGYMAGELARADGVTVGDSNINPYSAYSTTNPDSGIWTIGSPISVMCSDVSWSIDGSDILTIRRAVVDGKCKNIEKILDIDALFEGATVRIKEKTRIKIMGGTPSRSEVCARKKKDGTIIVYSTKVGGHCNDGTEIIIREFPAEGIKGQK